MTKQFQFDWFSHNIPSFEKHLAHLRDTPCRLLEIGCHEGRATTWLLENIANHEGSRVDCIDTHVQDVFWPNIAAAGGVQRVSFHRGTSQEVLRLLPINVFDFIFVDACHWTQNVLEDAVLSFPLCKTGGVIAFDDYLWDDPAFNRHGCPKPAVDFFLHAYADKLRVLELEYSVWITKLA